MGASPVIISALAFLSILSPELFRVVVPPELIGIAKRAALLPRDAVRVINGLSHLPLDTMRAIAVLDDPAEVTNETANVTVEDGEAGVIPYGAEPEAETTTEELPEEPGPENGTVTEETLPPKEPVPEIPPELSEEHNISTVMEEGKELFIEQVNATGGVVKETFTDPVLMGGGENASLYTDVFNMGQNLTVRLQNLTASLGKQASYKEYSDEYRNFVVMQSGGAWNNRYTGDLAQDLDNYQKNRENLDRMLQEAASDGIITQEEAEKLRRETERVRHESSVIQKGVGNAANGLQNSVQGMSEIALGKTLPYGDQEVIKNLIGGLSWGSGASLPKWPGGLSREIIDYLDMDREHLNERYKNLGGT